MAREALKLGPLGLGGAPLGNLYTAVSNANANATLSEATRREIHWFDVAPLYGYDLAEERLGAFLRARPDARPILSTKVGRVLEAAASAPTDSYFENALSYRPKFDYFRAGIERSYDESLRWLRMDRVQILLLHDIDRLNHPDSPRDVLAQVLDEALPVLNQMRSEGRVDAVGLGINQWDIGYEILASADVDCILLAGRYTLLDQTALTSRFLDTCARRNVSVLAGGVFNGGFLVGGSMYDYRPAGESLIERRDQLARICRRHEVSVPAAAIQFTASHPEELRHEGLIPPDAPTPDTRDMKCA